MLPQGTASFAPVSPQDPPYQGEVGQGGQVLMLDGNPWQWDAVIGAYKFREAQGEPWEFIYPLDPVGDPPVVWYVRTILPLGSTQDIPVQVGVVGFGS